MIESDLGNPSTKPGSISEPQLTTKMLVIRIQEFLTDLIKQTDCHIV